MRRCDDGFSLSVLALDITRGKGKAARIGLAGMLSTAAAVLTHIRSPLVCVL